MKTYFHYLTKLVLLSLCLFFSINLSAKKITGLVTDGDFKEPVIGANILIKGKTLGTVTDINGNYVLEVSPNDVLVFSYIGLENKEIKVGESNVLNVVLTSHSELLKEVVAIGYGVVKKGDLTGSVAVVSSKDLTKNPSTSAAQALQGKAPGVLVTQSGKPGGGASIRVRGVGSINKSSDPIFILDGVQVTEINGIQPQDIENFQVLKDASATAIYGANGANGVIIVNTKRGKSGKPVVNLNTFYGITLAPKHYDVMDASQYSNFLASTRYKANGLGKTYLNQNNVAVANPAYALSPEFRQKYYGEGWEKGTDWQNLVFKTGFSQNYNLSISGGGESSNFSTALNYSKEDGNVIKSNAEMLNLRANSDFKLSKYVKIGENLNVSYTSIEEPQSNQTNVWDLVVSPLMKVNNSNYKHQGDQSLTGFESYQTSYWEAADGSLHQVGYDGYTNQDSYSNTLGNDKPNILTAPTLWSGKNETFGTNASVYLQIDFTDWLMLKVTPSAIVKNYRSNIWHPAYDGNRGYSTSSLTESYYNDVTLNLENQLLFKKKFNNLHNVQATVVYQRLWGQKNLIAGTGNGFDYPQLNTLTNATGSKVPSGTIDDRRMLTYLGRVMYDFKGKYFATASLRSDGIQVFAPQYKRGNFASASLAWKVTEDFFKDIKNLDALKLRIGWGQTGNSSIGSNFQYYDQIYNANSFSPVFGDNQEVANARYIFAGFGSKEIHWESSEMTNIGIDANMFNTKLQVTAEYYVKNNNDLLIQLPTSSAFGRVDGYPWYNTGKIRNQGVELSLQWRDKVGEVNYGISSNLTTIKNEVLYMPVPDITSGNNRTLVGHSIGALYGYVSQGIIQPTDFAGKDPVTNLYTGYKYATQFTQVPQPGDIKYKDMNGDGNVNALDRTIIGKTIPSMTYTIGFDCAYKNFDFNLFLFGVGGFDIFNSQRASLSSMNSQDNDHNKLADWAANYWTETNQSTKYVRYDAANTNMNDQISSFWVESGSFLRIKDVQIGYNVPKSIYPKLGVSSLRLYANASNLYCFTSYKGRDPEGLMSIDPLNSGTDSGTYSIPQSFMFGLQIGF
ncbi:MAG: TonB-dependent receptor [Bacteroidales bacterium]|nr:TonB-dependent receptor [Bacteroidales bacterium]